MTHDKPKIDVEIYAAALEKALEELTESVADHEQLEEQLYAADKRIGKLRRGALGLAALCGRPFASLTTAHPHLFPDHIESDTGLTDAVREVLRSAQPASCSAVYIRDSLKAKGYDISQYKNVLASIHTILKRLKLKGEVKDSSNSDGRAIYRWVGKKPADTSF
jgi:multidrug resistance efflux pump